MRIEPLGCYIDEGAEPLAEVTTIHKDGRVLVVVESHGEIVAASPAA